MNPTPNRCPAAEGQSCKHGHAFTTGCLLPSEQNVPACCREDLVFDEQRQAVTIVRTDAAARFDEWKARNAGVQGRKPVLICLTPKECKSPVACDVKARCLRTDGVALARSETFSPPSPLPGSSSLEGGGE